MDKATKPPALPFKLYRVYNGFKECELESVKVIRITPTRWWFEKSGGLSFRCRTGIKPTMPDIFFTPREAWEAFLVDAQEARAEATKMVEHAERAILKLA